MTLWFCYCTACWTVFFDRLSQNELTIYCPVCKENTRHLQIPPTESNP